MSLKEIFDSYQLSDDDDMTFRMTIGDTEPIDRKELISICQKYNFEPQTILLRSARGYIVQTTEMRP